MIDTRILLYRDKTVVGRLIQWQTRSPYNHAALRIGTHFGIEATAPRVRHLTPGDREPALVLSLPLPDEQALAMRLWCHQQIGKPYDYTMVARFVTRQDEARRSSGKWFCSELVYAAYRHVGVDLLRDTYPWEVSPGLLARTPLGEEQTR